VSKGTLRNGQWVMEEAPTLSSTEDGGSLKENLRNALKVSGPLMEFHRTIRKGRDRLENIVGPADELALKRLEKSTRDFEELVETVSA
jgi:hypothetical protein